MNRLRDHGRMAPHVTEFTDGTSAGLELGLAEFRDYACGCIYEYGLFTRGDGALVWSWRRLAPCLSPKLHA